MRWVELGSFPAHTERGTFDGGVADGHGAVTLVTSPLTQSETFDDAPLTQNETYRLQSSRKPAAVSVRLSPAATTVFGVTMRAIPTAATTGKHLGNTAEVKGQNVTVYEGSVSQSVTSCDCGDDDGGAYKNQSHL